MPLTPRSLAPLLLCLLALAPAPRAAALSLPPIFSDGAVLQAGKPLPVFGQAAPGTRVTVTFAGHRAAAQAGPDGHWRADLPPLEPSAEPRKLSITAGDQSLTFADILVGEVGLVSGQSNMQWSLRNTERAEEALDDAREFPHIRILKVKIRRADEPGQPVQLDHAWVPALGDALADFSAVGYYFARSLREERGVPVGIVQSALGGSRIEPWMPHTALTDFPAGREAIEATPDLIQARIASRPDRPGWAEASRERIQPSGLYNGMIHGLAPYALRGFLWYQGESNSGEPQAYAALFPRLIRSWREHWEDPTLAFYYVQLSAFERDSWPAFRQVQLDTLDRVPGTAMAVTVDIGNATDIHPRNKRDVGARLARAALHNLYGRTALVPHSPIPAALSRAGEGALEVRFAHTGSGLTTSDAAAPRTFEVRLAEGDYQPATAAITGPATVRLTGFGEGEPAAVRYGWAAVPDGNLVNSAGLPASPFEMGLAPPRGRPGFSGQ